MVGKWSVQGMGGGTGAQTVMWLGSGGRKRFGGGGGGTGGMSAAVW